MKKNQILKKCDLTDQIVELEVYSPEIAKSALPGQFIIFKIDEKGERIPLTIADTNLETGAVTVVFQKVGASTMRLGELVENDVIMDFVGPLGTPSELPDSGRVAVIGGGLGCAIAYPQSLALHKKGVQTDLIAGFRDKSFIFWEDRMQNACSHFILCTDDGSYGFNGFVTTALEKQIQDGAAYDLVIAIGPVPMMKAVSNLTKKYGVKTIVSMNTIMIDGTGMCGGCRLTVGGQTKFACVDGPDFDGHLVDFDEVMRRNRVYQDVEKEALEKHECRLLKKAEEVKKHE